MKKKKKQSCSCTPQYDACKTVEPCKKTQKCEICKPCETVVECTPISSCKPCPTEKKPMNSYMECPCGDYEITCVDKCVELAKKKLKNYLKKLVNMKLMQHKHLTKQKNVKRVLNYYHNKHVIYCKMQTNVKINQEMMSIKLKN